ncbi:DEAD/DEAH box helicase [Bacteroides sp. ET71]|uniref:DEAD/DEAH box helicase n=1 Tax=Bacteroides sp. ET71 TaxID=2939421 RepID=UPI003979969B
MTEPHDNTARPLPQLKQRNLPETCRESVKALLKETYGYTDFRDLEIYDDLFRGKDKISISQGQLIEHVLREAEKGLKGTPEVDNILLTAPTGSGKSLLFQLPAIWLGREHGTLTLVVSPLKALIVDQVESLQEIGYTRVGYASSDLSPEQKAEVYRQVREGEIDLFYLSPELLLSYDIRHFTGDRRIGLVVVDEAHTVTTWGKEFRVDYWFLGRYLTGLKETLGYAFPLFALTATAVWNPQGDNDMVFETIRSLQMAPCVLYIGTVRRHNIGFDIRQMTIDEGETYDKAKQRVISARIEEYLEKHKTLLYYPFAGGIDMRIKSWVRAQNWHLVASYYGKKEREQKAEIVQDFKNGEKRLIVATKAFGMGVDISDIDRVYHVAPSSTFVDYIQEVGRAARDTNVQGIAATDFHERDFYYMKRLHQMGNIAQEQLALILQKLVEVYQMKGEKPEMLVSLSDFEFVVKLPRTKNKLEYETELGQFTKTALLWLEDDIARRYGSRLLEISPRNLLTEGYIQDKTGPDFARQYAQWLTPVAGEEGVYKARLEKLWEEGFPELGYKEFKQKLNNGTLREGSRAVAVGKHEVLLKENATEIRQKLDALFKSLTNMMKMALIKNKGKFEEEELRNIFAEHQMDVRSAKRFIGSLLESRTEEGRSVSYISSAKKKESTDLLFTVTRGFDLLLSRYQKLCSQRITGTKGERLTFYCTPFSDLNTLLNLLSMLGCLSFSVEGGGTPCVLVRLNDPETLLQLATTDNYRNRILDTNEQIFMEQIELFTLFFGTDRLDDTQRWDFVEDYFTGMSVDELKGKYGARQAPVRPTTSDTPDARPRSSNK